MKWEPGRFRARHDRPEPRRPREDEQAPRGRADQQPRPCGARGSEAAALTESCDRVCRRPIKSIRKAIRQAAARSGVPCSPHVFRHTAGVMMAQADVPMQKIAQYLGHTSTRVTERVYARYSPSFMRDASAALDW
jgi:site-specific recombinase XerD